MDFVKEINGEDFYFHHTLNVEPSANFFKLHSHNAFELYLFIGGNGKINIEGRFFNLEPWDLYFISPGLFHRVLLESDTPYERRVIRFDYSFIRRIDPKDILINSLSEYNVIKGKVIRNSRIPHIYERINEILDYDKHIQKIAFYSILIDLLLNISKLSSTINSDKIILDEGQPHPKINEIIKYINENLTQDLSLDSLSKKFFISKYYLSRLFKESTGSTLGHYVLTKRLLYAKRLIIGGTTPINACFASGFSDYSSFYKSYKKYLGVTPSKTK